MLGFTNTWGEAICCVIIIACSEITAKHEMGLQPWVDYVGDPEIDMAENLHGIESGREIEIFITCSESGTVTTWNLMRCWWNWSRALLTLRWSWKPLSITVSGLHFKWRHQVGSLNWSALWHPCLAGWWFIWAKWSLQIGTCNNKINVIRDKNKDAIV